MAVNEYSVYGYVWLCMNMYGMYWLCMAVCGYVWPCKAVYMTTCLGMGIRKAAVGLDCQPPGAAVFSGRATSGISAERDTGGEGRDFSIRARSSLTVPTDREPGTG